MQQEHVKTTTFIIQSLKKWLMTHFLISPNKSFVVKSEFLHAYSLSCVQEENQVSVGFFLVSRSYVRGERT